MRFHVGVLAMALSIVGGGISHGGEITATGKQLAKALDAMNVEKLWLAKHFVNWKTGEPLDKPVTDNKPHTHCSAFVAAFCMMQDVYILRPPDHSETLLANAQYDWLIGPGKDVGWKPVKGEHEAQRMANSGNIVVAVFKSADPKKSGHIAIVLPSSKSDESIREEGPQITQAGGTNYASTSLVQGFKAHPPAWRDHEIRFFAHEVTWK